MQRCRPQPKSPAPRREISGNLYRQRDEIDWNDIVNSIKQDPLPPTDLGVAQMVECSPRKGEVRGFESHRPDQIWTAKSHRQTRRSQAIAYKGGKCIDCNNSDERVLEFDHTTERRNGRPTVAHFCSGSWERLKEELDKCDLVCANCHKIRQLDQPKYEKAI